MIEHGKISLSQLMTMMYPAILATALLSVPSITMIDAGHDMWLSPLWGSLAGVASLFLALGICKLCPQQTMIQAGVSILGFWFGKLYGLIYLLYLPHLIGVILRNYGEFVSSRCRCRDPPICHYGHDCYRLCD